MTDNKNKNEWEILQDNIKNWVKLDNELKQLNEKTKKIRIQKSALLNKITNNNLMNSNLLNTQFNFSNEKLVFTKQRWTQPLTYNFLNNCLVDLLEDNDQVDYLINSIKDNRQQKYYIDIKRISN